VELKRCGARLPGDKTTRFDFAESPKGEISSGRTTFSNSGSLEIPIDFVSADEKAKL
jgi:hypothetical protein